jgi:hypothetical protein
VLIEAKRGKRRAFVFTFDALLALALVTALVSVGALASFAHQPRNEKLFELEQLGFDSLALKHGGFALTDGEFAKLSGGFQAYHSIGDASTASAHAVARARYYEYLRLCECASFPCGVSQSAECLSSPDLVLPRAAGAFNYSEVWVTP